MGFSPEWSVRVSKSGGPEQPLRADSVRNAMVRTIARGITTDIPPRGRYLSGFCWAMHRVNEHPETSELSGSDRRRILKGFEEVLALASSRRQHIHGSVMDGLGGLTGKTNATDDAVFESSVIDLDEFALLNNSLYAMRGFQPNLGNFYLKEGELTLTPAGQTLAEALDEVAGEYFERILEAVQSGRLPLELLDELADAFSHQGCFTSENNDAERDALQRVILGIVGWDSGAGSVVVEPWPARLGNPVREHCEYIVGEERFSNDLQDAVVGGVHQLRRAWCLAILRAHHLLATHESGGGELAYDARDRECFEQFRPIGRSYFLQVELAYALRASLWGLSAHLEREAPGGQTRRDIVGHVDASIVDDEVDSLLHAETTLGDDRLGESAITRELLCAGRVLPRSYEITVPNTTESQALSLGELRDTLRSDVLDTWRPVTDDDITGRTLLVATTNAFDAVRNATSPGMASESLTRLLTRSTVLLVGAIEQYRQLVDDDPLHGRYMTTRFGRQPSSLVQSTRYLDSLDQALSLTELIRRILSDRVIDVHNYVVQDRLGSGPISLVFGTGADAGDSQASVTGESLYFVGGTRRPRTQSLRYTLLRRLLRDASLLEYVPGRDLWVPTAAGVEVLERFRGEHE